MADPIPLYRFLDSDAALKTLAAGTFRVGQQSKFNDPFEWRLGFTNIKTPQQKEFAETFSPERLQWREKWAGFLCFSKTVSDPTLWSLYADKHSGVAFEVKYPWPEDNIVEMTYSPERPVLDFDRWLQIQNKDEKAKYLWSLLAHFMTRKSPSWSFEQERRLSIDINDRRFCQLSDGRHYWQIPRDGLKRVILGFCCPLEEAIVRKLLDMNGFAATVVGRAKLCQETYSVIV